MIVRLSSAAPPELTDVGRLDRLSAVCPDSLDTMLFDDLCMPGPDADHVWLSVRELRQRGAVQSDDRSFVAAFDGMIAFAGSKGWLNDDGSCVRAHVEAG